MWWENVIKLVPLLGYHPKSSKSWLIVELHLMDTAHEIFAGTKVNFASDGHKYIGGFIRNDKAKSDYFQTLSDKGIAQLNLLSEIARPEPRAEFAAFVPCYHHKFYLSS